MKTLLSTLGLLAMLATSAAAAPYVLPSPQTGSLQSYDWQPVYSIDVVSAIADDNNEPDMWGPRLSLGLYSATEGDFIHEFSASASALFGSGTYYDVQGYGADYDATTIPLVLGYDLYINLIGDLYLDLGVNAGYSFLTVEATDFNHEVDSAGFTFSAGAGLLYKATEDIYVKLGYEYSRSYFEKSAGGILDQHMITLGIGCQF